MRETEFQLKFIFTTLSFQYLHCVKSIQLLAKSVPESPKHPDSRLCSQTLNKSSIAEGIIHTTHLACRGKAGSYIDPSLLPSSDFGMERYAATCKIENTNLSIDPLIYNAVWLANYARAMVIQILWEKSANV